MGASPTVPSGRLLWIEPAAVGACDISSCFPVPSSLILKVSGMTERSNCKDLEKRLLPSLCCEGSRDNAVDSAARVSIRVETGSIVRGFVEDVQGNNRFRDMEMCGAWVTMMVEAESRWKLEGAGAEVTKGFCTVVTIWRGGLFQNALVYMVSSQQGAPSVRKPSGLGKLQSFDNFSIFTKDTTNFRVHTLSRRPTRRECLTTLVYLSRQKYAFHWCQAKHTM
jgi:hypothetical protein